MIYGLRGPPHVAVICPDYQQAIARSEAASGTNLSVEAPVNVPSFFPPPSFSHPGPSLRCLSLMSHQCETQCARYIRYKQAAVRNNQCPRCHLEPPAELTRNPRVPALRHVID